MSLLQKVWCVDWCGDGYRHLELNGVYSLSGEELCRRMISWMVRWFVWIMFAVGWKLIKTDMGNRMWEESVSRDWNGTAITLEWHWNDTEMWLDWQCKCIVIALKCDWNYTRRTLKKNWNGTWITLSLHWNYTKIALQLYSSGSGSGISLGLHWNGTQMGLEC